MDDVGHRRGGQLVKRMYRPRILGCLLGFVCVFGVLWNSHINPLWWPLVGFHAFIWPHVAFFIALRAQSPFLAEHRNLLIDSLFGGIWVALMQFNLLPSLVLLVMLSMSNISVAGLRWFMRGVLAQAVGAFIAVLLVGLHIQLFSSFQQILTTLPLVITYPLLIGLITYRLAMSLSEQNLQIKKLSVTDSLTGLSNRREFEHQFSKELARCRRLNSTAVLILLDIDHFKRINDQGGHASGDDALRLIAQKLTEQLRPMDVIGRIGGEEFAIILPDTNLPSGFITAERLRAEVSALQLPKAPYTCTISLGVAPLQADMANCNEWLAEADRALYQAKQQGRNQTVLAAAQSEPG